MTSAFDSATFMDATTQDALTRRPPIPAGTELIGIIGEPKPRQSQGKKDPSATFTFLDLPVELDLSQNPALMTMIGQQKVTLTYGFMVDITPSGGLDTSPGKNGRLRQVREALGMNTPGQAFNPRMLQGRQIRVKISHRINDMDGETYDQIDGVAKG